MSLPPLIPSILENLEKYLTDPSELPIHRTEPAIKVWERVPNLKRELQVEHGPLSTTIQVERDLKTGDVKGYREIDVSATGCSLSDQHILSSSNPNTEYNLRRFTQIVLKFKTQVLQILKLKTICVNLLKLEKISGHILG